MPRKTPLVPADPPPIHPVQSVRLGGDTMRRLADIAATFPVRLSVGKLIELAIRDSHERRCQPARAAGREEKRR